MHVVADRQKLEVVLVFAYHAKNADIAVLLRESRFRERSISTVSRKQAADMASIVNPVTVIPAFLVTDNDDDEVAAADTEVLPTLLPFSAEDTIMPHLSARAIEHDIDIVTKDASGIASPKAQTLRYGGDKRPRAAVMASPKPRASTVLSTSQRLLTVTSPPVPRKEIMSSLYTVFIFDEQAIACLQQLFGAFETAHFREHAAFCIKMRVQRFYSLIPSLLRAGCSIALYQPSNDVEWRIHRFVSPANTNDMIEALAEDEVRKGVGSTGRRHGAVAAYQRADGTLQIAVISAETNGKVVHAYEEEIMGDITSTLDNVCQICVQLNIAELRVMPSQSDGSVLVYESLLKRLLGVRSLCAGSYTCKSHNIAQIHVMQPDDSVKASVSCEGVSEVLMRAIDLLKMTAMTEIQPPLASETNDFIIAPVFLEYTLRVSLDALYQLDIFAEGATTGKGVRCVYDVVNRCCTRAGSKLLKSMFTGTMVRLDAIQSRQHAVKWLCDNVSTLRACREALRKIADIDVIASKMRNTNANKRQSRLTIRDMVQLYETIAILGTVSSSNALIDGENEYVSTLSKISDIIIHMMKFKGLVETCIHRHGRTTGTDETDISWEMEDYNVNPALHPSLSVMFKNFENSRAALQASIQKVITASPIVRAGKTYYGAIDWNHKVYGHHIRVSHALISPFRSTYMEPITKRKRGAPAASHSKSGADTHTSETFIDLGVRADGLHVTTATLKAASRNHSILQAEYRAKQAAIEQEILRIAASYEKHVSQLCECVATLDLLAAFAETAVLLGWKQPTIFAGAKQETLRLEGLRHPLIPPADVISNDILLRRTVGSASMGEMSGPSMAIITGANMGGKSTFMKSVAIAAILAHMGCHVPADRAEIPLMSGIFVAKLGKDDIGSGFSSFTAHMSSIAACLRSMDARSLSLFDEIGKGTSTIEGVSLAAGIVNHLLGKPSGFTLFATHFHELAEFGSINGRVDTPFELLDPPSTCKAINLHAAADVRAGKLLLLYRMVSAAAPKASSLTLNVAESMGMPADIVAEAREIVKEVHHL